MYYIVSIISAIIRQFLLPNPFMRLFSNHTYADLFNIVVGDIILHFLAYTTTGVIYDRNTAPGLGSLLYLINYCLYTGIIIFITCLIKNIWLSIITCLIAYILILIFLRKMSDKNRGFYI